jgi:hypothetical protein
MNFLLDEDYLLIKDKISFLLIGKVQEPFTLFIETMSKEICQSLDLGDLVVVSAPEGGDPFQGAILLELIRKYHVPLVVLPKDHPGSKRLKMVVSAGDYISISCSIQRGTHPEQYLLCGTQGMTGIEFTKIENGVDITGFTENHLICRMNKIII